MRRGMARYLLRRIALIPLSLFVLVTFSFLLVELMPGDPVTNILGPFASEGEVERIRSELGLDLPLGERYLDYVGSLLRGDLGTSFYTRQPVIDSIATFLPNTIELMVMSIAVALVLGLVLGTIAAVFRNRLPDKMTRAVITALQSVPDFLLGLLLIYLLFTQLGVADAPTGRLGVGSTRPEGATGFLIVDSLLARDFSLLSETLRKSVMPVLTLGLVYAAFFAKTARATLSESLRSDQVAFARVCGLPRHQVLRYAFTTARTPIVTYGTIVFASLIGGASIVETVFSWRGLGQWGLASILNLDIPAIQGFVLITGVATLLLYLLLDLVTTAMDPRVRIR